VHFAQIAARALTVWAFCPYSVHFARIARQQAMKWAKCTLAPPAALPSRSSIAQRHALTDSPHQQRRRPVRVAADLAQPGQHV
jgi:hypothetical protein